MKIEDLDKAVELQEQLKHANTDIRRLSNTNGITVNGVTFYSPYEDTEAIRCIALKLAHQEKDRIEKEIEAL